MSAGPTAAPVAGRPALQQAGAWRRVRLPVLAATSAALLTVGSLVMLAAAILTLFLARRFYAGLIGRWIGRAVLRLWGVRHVVRRTEPFPQRQVVYVSNHTSTLDIFLLVALGLPLARAVHAASGAPARLLGRDDLGALRPGAPAHVAVLDDALQVTRTLVGGVQAWP